MFRSRFRSVVAWVLTMCAVWSVTPVQAQSTGKLALAHIAPEECLLFVTWNGWTASDPKSTNRTEKLFAEESVRDFFHQLDAEITKSLDNAASRQGGQASIAEKAIVLLLKTAASHPGAIYVSKFRIISHSKMSDAPEYEGALVLDAGTDGPQAVEALKNLLSLIPPNQGDEEKIGDATFWRPKKNDPSDPDIRIGYRASQLLVVLGKETPQELLAKLQNPGKPAAWVTKLLADLAVDRPSMLSQINVEQVLKSLQPFLTDEATPRQFASALNALGLTTLKHWSSVSGLDKTGMHSTSVFATEGAPRGLFDLIPNKPLSIDDFKKIPANAVNATVARFDLAYLFDKFLAGVEQVDENVPQMIEGQIAQIEPQLGFSFKDDLFAGLGDTWSVYVSSSEPVGMFVPGLVISASVRKHEGVEKALKVLVAAAQATLANFGPQAPFSVQEFTAKGEKGYRIQFNNLPIPVAPTWVLTKDQLVIGITPQLVTAHLGTAGKASMADNEQIKAAFKWAPKPTVVSYSDPKPTVQAVYSLVASFGQLLVGQLAQGGINFNLPPLPPFADIEQHLAPSVSTIARTENGWRTESHGVVPSVTQMGPAGVVVAAALVLPAVGTARVSAQRQQGANSLKQIGLAMHNYHSTHNAFPPAANVDKKGKQLLSWRVHILPFVDQIALYQQFHLDEPWDSAHNKELIQKIPPVYISPKHADLAKDGKTVYLVPTGKSTAFEGKEGLAIREFTDGTSNTILAVEAHRDSAVIWTKLDDLAVDFKNPLKGLKGVHTGGFFAALCDGSVRFISDNIDLDTLKALFTRNGGEALPVGR